MDVGGIHQVHNRHDCGDGNGEEIFLFARWAILQKPSRETANPQGIRMRSIISIAPSSIAVESKRGRA